MPAFNRSHWIVLSFSLTAAVVCASGCPNREATMRQVVFGGNKSLDIVKSASDVQAFLINGSDFDAGQPSTSYPVREGPVALNADQRKQLVDVLTSADIYEFDSAKACLPIPGVKIEFAHDKHTVSVLFCFECNILLVYLDGAMVGSEDFDRGRPRIVRVLKQLFPENAVIQGLPETGSGLGDKSSAASKTEPRDVGQTVTRPDDPPVTYVDDDDPQMNAAVQKSRDTVDQFIAALDDPGPAQTSFAVKMKISDGTHTEHMWVNSVRHENGRFFGTLGNDPDLVQGVKFQDPVDVAKEEISDWMYIDDNTLVGGYTLRVLRDRMTAAEREEFDRRVPFRVQ
jgi:uncharacterized protein YegJ (DUF2314 family)